MRSSTSQVQTFPRIINFIWLGGPIPTNYLNTINAVATAAKRSGFEVNLWVDKEENYIKTSVATGINPANLQVRNITELLDNMKQDPFYQHEDRFEKFKEVIGREMVGFKNLAAAADLLRYEILRQKGGYYFDVDSEFPELAIIDKPAPIKPLRKKGQSEESYQQELNSYKEELKYRRAQARSLYHPDKVELKPETTQLGIKFNAAFLFDEEDRIENYANNNDVIAAMPNHPVMENMIIYNLLEHAQLDRQKTTRLDAKEFKRVTGYNLNSNHAKNKQGYVTTKQDQKRFPLTKKEVEISESFRANLTLNTSGPFIFFLQAIKFWQNKTRQNFKERLSKKGKELLLSMTFPTNLADTKKLGIKIGNINTAGIYYYFDRVRKVANTVFIPKSDQNWLKKIQRKDSFDTESIPRTIPSSNHPTSQYARREKALRRGIIQENISSIATNDLTDKNPKISFTKFKEEYTKKYPNTGFFKQAKQSGKSIESIKEIELYAEKNPSSKVAQVLARLKNR